MAKIRAYKLAEELGIDRHDFVDRAADAGVVLKNSMASLDEVQEAELREKLGQPAESGKQVVESRVERKGGKTVLRRRKRGTEWNPFPVLRRSSRRSRSRDCGPTRSLFSVSCHVGAEGAGDSLRPLAKVPTQSWTQLCEGAQAH